MRGGKIHGREYRPRCSTGKIIYDKRDAEVAINRAKGHTRASKRPIRHYHCSTCNRYHLTSHEETDYEDRQELPLIMEDKFRDIINKTE